MIRSYLFGSNTRRILSGLAAALGSIASVIAISGMFTGDVTQLKVTDRSDIRTILNQDDIDRFAGDVNVSADQLEIYETLFLPAGNHAIIANRIEFHGDAQLRVSEEGVGHVHVVFASPHLVDLNVDLSGVSGSADGAPGVSGGDITVLAGRIEGGRIVSNGGDGGRGRQGDPGLDGRRGQCGAGRYQGARNGGPGQPGKDGGAGGDAGKIEVFLGEFSQVGMSAVGGSGGSGGLGGPGGQGGAGCTGLGGTQASRSSGPVGVPGANGAEGNSYSPIVSQFDFADFAKRLRQSEEPFLLLKAKANE